MRPYLRTVPTLLLVRETAGAGLILWVWARAQPVPGLTPQQKQHQPLTPLSARKHVHELKQVAVILSFTRCSQP